MGTALAVNLPPVYNPAPAPYHPAPAYKSAPYDETPKPYAFEYGVADDYSGAKFAQSETADGKLTSGSYSVNLPDGRIQTVTYTVDDYAGYVADIKYEGTPHYPDYKPTFKAAPAYKPVPPAFNPASASVYHAYVICTDSCIDYNIFIVIFEMASIKPL